MTEREALETFFAEWHRQANECGESLTQGQRDCAEEAWHAALAWQRSLVEPAAWQNIYMPNEILTDDDIDPMWKTLGDMRPLYLAPQPSIENDDREYLSAIAMLGSAMRRLVIAARTSGGTAGPDAELMSACEQAEDAMTIGAIGRAMEAPQPAIPDGYVIAPDFRGYAVMGAGQYLLDACPPDERGPSLIISIATEEEKAGRVVGDLRDPTPGRLIQPEQIAIRIDFLTVAGLDALEQQLRILREDYFDDPEPTK